MLHSILTLRSWSTWAHRFACQRQKKAGLAYSDLCTIHSLVQLGAGGPYYLVHMNIPFVEEGGVRPWGDARPRKPPIVGVSSGTIATSRCASPLFKCPRHGVYVHWRQGWPSEQDNARVRNRGVTDIRLGICPLIVSTRSSDEKAGEVGDNVIRLCLWLLFCACVGHGANLWSPADRRRQMLQRSKCERVVTKASK